MDGSVWVVACTVLGRGVLFVCVDLLVDMDIGGCAISVCVDASTRVEMVGATSSVCVATSTERKTGGCGVGEWGASLGCGSPKG